MGRLNRLNRPRAHRREAGYTLVELLVVVLLTGALAAIVGSLAVHFGHVQQQQQERMAQLNLMNDASTMLDQDVRDATVLRKGTAHELDLLISRADPEDGQTRCADRDWVIDPDTHTISLTSVVYEKPDCTGATAPLPTTQLTIPRVDVDTSTFTYTMRGQLGGHQINLANLADGQIQNGHDIGEIDWTWSTQAYADGTQSMPLAFTDSANIQADGTDPATRSTALQASPAVLTVITTPEGKVAPTLQWVDPNPDITTSYTVLRDAYPEGEPDNGDLMKFDAVFTPSDPATHTWTWTDNKAGQALPAGWTARYSVMAGLKDNTWGPESNIVATGLRPDQVQNVIATGHPTSISLTWDPQVGATGYDIYRDGNLIAWTTGHDSTSFTDQPGVLGWAGSGYGHSHTYNVVAVNRWEDLLTTGIVNKPLDPTHTPPYTVTQEYMAATTRLASADTPAAGAFTAPAAPTITVTPTTSWGMTVAWTPAPWVGSGPTSKDGVARDRGWVVSTNGSPSASPDGTWTPEWGGAETTAGTTSRLVSYTQGQVAGQYRTYTAATVNPVGASPASSPVTGLQRPPTPTCTANATSTRAATVTVDRPAIPSAYTASSVSGGVKADGASSVTGTGVQAGTTFGIDGLMHATTSTFTAANQNGSPANGGWSDSTNCATTTATLGVTITGWSSSTRTINATASAQNGSSQNITLEGVATIGGLSGTWDPLPDGTGYTVTARNSDGVNNVAARVGVATKVLAAPGAPGCTTSVSGGVGNASLTVSGGAQVKLGSGGTVYASPRTYVGLSGGTYTGYARNTSSDGYNVSYSGWSNCGSGFIPTVIGSGYSGWDDICAAHAGDGAVRDQLFSSAVSQANPQNETINAPELDATAAVLLSQNADGSYRCGFSVAYQGWTSRGATGNVYFGTVVMGWNSGGGGVIFN